MLWVKCLHNVYEGSEENYQIGLSRKEIYSNSHGTNGKLVKTCSVQKRLPDIRYTHMFKARLKDCSLQFIYVHIHMVLLIISDFLII